MKKPDIEDVFYQNYRDMHKKFAFDYMVKKNHWHTDDTMIIAGFNNEMDAKRFCLIEDMIDALIEIELVYESASCSTELDRNLENPVSKARKALEKAGIEFN